MNVSFWRSGPRWFFSLCRVLGWIFKKLHKNVKTPIWREKGSIFWARKGELFKSNMDDLTVHIFGTQFLLDPFSGSRIFRIGFFSWNYQTCVTYCVLRREKSSSSHCTSICNSVGIVSLEAHSRAETVWCHEHGEKTPFLHTSTEKKMVVVRWPVNFTSNWLQFCWQMEIGVVAACRPWCTIHQCSK